MTPMLPVTLWTSYWLKTSQLFWSSSEVIARRGVKYLSEESSRTASVDFDGMVSEKSAAAIDSWWAMAFKMGGACSQLVSGVLG